MTDGQTEAGEQIERDNAERAQAGRDVASTLRAIADAFESGNYPTGQPPWNLYEMTHTTPIVGEDGEVIDYRHDGETLMLSPMLFPDGVMNPIREILGVYHAAYCDGHRDGLQVKNVGEV